MIYNQQLFILIKIQLIKNPADQLIPPHASMAVYHGPISIYCFKATADTF